MKPRYTAKVIEKIDNGKGTWGSLRIGVFDGEQQIGEYTRNYHAFMNTFEPFALDGKDYALYSRHYTGTRIMELPSCKDIGGEEPDAVGFCPTGYYAPWYVQRTVPRPDGSERVIEFPDSDFDNDDPPKPDEAIIYRPFAFVSGCVWGDDSSWKIQYIDLSEAVNGSIKRDERFGYIEMPGNLKLRECVGVLDRRYVQITSAQTYSLDTGKVEE